MKKKTFIPPPKSQEFQLPSSDYEWLVGYIRYQYPEFTNHKFQIQITRLADGSLEGISYRIRPEGEMNYEKRFFMDHYDSLRFRIESKYALSDIYHAIQKSVHSPLGALLRSLL